MLSTSTRPEREWYDDWYAGWSTVPCQDGRYTTGLNTTRELQRVIDRPSTAKRNELRILIKNDLFEEKATPLADAMANPLWLRGGTYTPFSRRQKPTDPLVEEFNTRHLSSVLLMDISELCKAGVTFILPTKRPDLVFPRLPLEWQIEGIPDSVVIALRVNSTTNVYQAMKSTLHLGCRAMVIFDSAPRDPDLRLFMCPGCGGEGSRRQDYDYAGESVACQCAGQTPFELIVIHGGSQMWPMETDQIPNHLIQSIIDIGKATKTPVFVDSWLHQRDVRMFPSSFRLFELPKRGGV